MVVNADKGEEEIYSFSYWTTMFVMIISSFLGITAYMIYQKISHNAYFAGIIGTVIGFLLLFGLINLRKYMGDKDIFEYNIFLFGNIFGNIVNIFLVCVVFFIATIFFETIAQFVNSNYLIETSVNYIKVLLLSPIAFAASKKISTISKISQGIFIATLFFFSISYIGIFGQFDIKRIFPVMSCGIDEALKCGIIYACTGLFSMFLLTCIPNSKIHSDNKNVLKMVLVYLFANIIIVLIMLAVVLILGEELILIYKFPEYLTLQEFSIFSIIERVENILALQFILFNFLTLTIMVYFIYNYIKRIIKGLAPKLSKEVLNKNYLEISITIGICLVIWIFTNCFYKSSLFLTYIIKNYYIYITLGGVILPMFIILFFGILKNMKNKKQNIAN